MELTQSHRVTYAEICVPMADPAKSECHHVMNKPHNNTLEATII